MAKSKETKLEEIRTGNDVVNYAKQRGADVTPNAHGRFTAIETPAGKMHILPGNEPLDKQTRSNVKRWLGFLGLAMFPVLCWVVDFLWGVAGLPRIF